MPHRRALASLAAIALCALLAAAVGCARDSAVAPGPLGAVELTADEPIQIGALLAFSELPELSQTVADGVRAGDRRLRRDRRAGGAPDRSARQRLLSGSGSGCRARSDSPTPT